MLWKIVSFAILLGVVPGCRSDPPFAGEHPRELVGTWRLLVRSSCIDYGVVVDTLVLHANGTFEQRVEMKDGRHLETTGQHWKYGVNDGKGDILLDKRLEFFLPEISHTSIGSGASMLEDLPVHGGPDPVILLNPDSDCVYGKV